MLPATTAEKRVKKGHAYSQFDAFRQLPILTQILLIVVVVLLFFVVLFHISAPSIDDVTAKIISENSEGSDNSNFLSLKEKKSVKKDKADGTEDAQDDTVPDFGGRTILTMSERVQQLEKENLLVRRELKRANKALAAAGVVGGVAPAKPGFKDGERGAPVGSFDWESLTIEANSTDRRFWIKTATNEEGHHFYRRIMISNGWIETTNPKHENCYFLFYGRFVPNLDQEYDMFVEGQHMINHIPGEFAVLNKEPFLYYIRNHSRSIGCDYTEMHPESYLIHDPSDCYDLFKTGDTANAFVTTGESPNERDETYWFWKPPFNSFGRGIKISKLSDIKENFGFGSQLAESGDADKAVHAQCKLLAANLTENGGKFLIQRAVHKPFLIKGSKFDFRAYLLITNAKPWSVYFKFGHVRRCLRPFDITSTVKKAHVCNDYSDEMEQNPNFPLDDHIWGYDKFKAYLIQQGYTDAQIEQGFITNLKKAFLGVFSSVKDAIPKKNGYWLLMGLDIAIDEDWRVKVLEVNTNPSVHYDTKVWGRDVVSRSWQMMNEIIELVYDAHLKAPRVPIPRKELVRGTKYGWHLIYSEQVKPAFAISDAEKKKKDKCFRQSPLTSHPKRK